MMTQPPEERERPEESVPPREHWSRRYWSYRAAPFVPYPGCLVLYSIVMLLFLFWLFVLFLPTR